MPSLWDLALAGAALALALAVRPWRALGPGGPPWPWLAWPLVVMPLAWTADRAAAIPVAPPLSGACLLMLMTGWPLAVLSLPVVALIALGVGGIDAAQALHRAVWLGVVPASLALAVGAAVRRWLPNHLFVYILGRGFFATALAGSGAGALALLLDDAPSGLAVGDLLLARFLAAWGDAFITGMMVAIFVAFRPQWLATYADRIWLQPPRPPAPPPRQKS